MPCPGVYPWNAGCASSPGRREERGAHALRPAPHRTREVAKALQGTGWVQQESGARLRFRGAAPVAVSIVHGRNSSARAPALGALEVAHKPAYHAGMTAMAFGYIAVGDFSSAESDKVLITLMLRTRCNFVCDNT